MCLLGLAIADRSLVVLCLGDGTSYRIVGFVALFFLSVCLMVAIALMLLVVSRSGSGGCIPHFLYDVFLYCYFSDIVYEHHPYCFISPQWPRNYMD